MFKRYFSGYTWVVTDVLKATKNAFSHAYSKRQIQDGKWADKNTSKTILMDKAGVKILFFGRSNWGKEKEKPWSRGTNSRLPPNLYNNQPANADGVFPQNTSAFSG